MYWSAILQYRTVLTSIHAQIAGLVLTYFSGSFCGNRNFAIRNCQQVIEAFHTVTVQDADAV